MPALQSISAEDLCVAVNAQLQQLRYHFAETASGQVLQIEGLPPVSFDPHAGGAVGGGSSRWMRTKHSQGRIHEPGLVATLLALRELQCPVHTVLDIGALYGYFSFLGAAAFERAQVHALEMNPASYRALLKNKTVNLAVIAERVHALNCALAERSERGKRVHIENFTLRQQQGGWMQRVWGIAKNVMGMLYFQNLAYRRSIESMVDFWSLDELCAQQKWAPSLIKIDVEGYQAHIIPGALKILEEAKPVVLLEFDSPEAVNASAQTNKDIVAPLFEMGYRLVWGRHRDPQAVFEAIGFEDMNQEHESNSLGIFVPA